MDLKQLLFTWRGRSGRKHYWIGIGLLLLVSLIPEVMPEPAKTLLNSVLTLAMIWPNICIMTKRFHDLGLSGWWQLAPIPGVLAALLIWLVGSAVFGAPETEAGTVWTGAVLIVGAIAYFGFYIWLGSVRGQPIANAYGPPPGAQSAAEEAEVFS